MELAVLLLLEKLTPTERAAYVLRESFDYPYAEIADDPRSSNQANVRQLVSRARKHLADRPARPGERPQRTAGCSRRSSSQPGPATSSGSSRSSPPTW